MLQDYKENVIDGEQNDNNEKQLITEKKNIIWRQ